MSFTLPSGEYATPLLRTDPSRPAQWQALQACIATPNADGFLANVKVITDPQLDGLTEDQILRLPRFDEAERFVLVADERALADDEFPILVFDISGENLPPFRVACRCLWAVQNNLSLANMDWAEFSDATDPDGVYRDCG
jgi:hypothetical protein